MMKFTLMSALLLCSLSWISVSGSESQTVAVKPGEDVTLLCSNFSKSPTHTFWSRLVSKTKMSCISSIFGSDGEAVFCDGVQNGNFEMSSNISAVVLKIKQVDVSDSGMYFCGFYIDAHTVMNVTYLNGQGSDEYQDDFDGKSDKKPEGVTDLTSVILGGLTVFLTTVIIGLVVKVRKLQTAQLEVHSSSDEPHYTAISILPNTQRRPRPASKTAPEPNVVYAATR